ncbi:hypothetical protein TBLA_0C05260 [Henningerozyma blattae CBS 6284]|uniref:Aminopeptidase P N-terminal domain-containing protein n=1 Tax=Henningerozyma blattae (strain ATCC 34711 / CBS 6284 / DSM 70876 / NBRC 10599 / NRRL Y-10934 / UCD 77-7) TaxID=1071380 RepID=I2H1S0_HENB6|nr:hypothetical protein TBLA_0C05260 [Tetrapisispora blattae CBS 6284]CCH60322.1 hypothetical protein TBLA_0C05260 [Tetrapisispora blattae CBS 6284]
MLFFITCLSVTFSFVLFFAFKRQEKRISRSRTHPKGSEIIQKEKHEYKDEIVEMLPLADVNDMPTSIRGKKYPAKAHLLKTKKILLNKNKDISESTTAIFIAGEEIEPRKYCDTTKPFRQNRYFFYFSGVDIPAASLLFDFKTEKSTLFLPNIDWDDVMWSGLPQSIEEAKEAYDFDEIIYADKIEDSISKLSGYSIYTTDLDNVHISSLSKQLIPSDKDFFYAMDESRVTKDAYEIALMKKAAHISDNSHLAVMSALPIELNEMQIEAEFCYHATRQGGRSLGYNPICCSGPACGTLHYNDNDQDLEGKESVLIDAGAEWRNYNSDVTRCFPINGKFTKEHRAIYETVLDMQTQAMCMIKPGASWDDIHILTHKILIKHFRALGIFKNTFTEEEIFDRQVSCAFYPHGLGHMLGLDVHDVAGYANYEDPNPYFKYLRIRRKLQENMVVTNEPGCYFNEFLLKEFLEKYPERKEVVDEDVLKKYMYVGGVRIEDDIVVTKDGCENMNSLTSDPDEIEKIVSEGLKKSRSDFHVIV